MKKANRRVADAYRIAGAVAMAAGDCDQARSLLEKARDAMLAGAEPYPSRWHAAWQELERTESAGC